MNAIKTITAAAISIAFAATIAACGTSEPPVVIDPTPSISATAEPTAEPTTPSPTEPATPEVVIPTEAGALVTAELVEQAREAGVAVYVSPTGDGSGVVVDPTATLPEQVIAEAEAIDGASDSVTGYIAALGSTEAILTAYDAAGVKAIVIFAMADMSPTSVKVTGYTAVGTVATGKFTASGSKGDVVAAAQAFAAANPGTTVIDLTD